MNYEADFERSAILAEQSRLLDDGSRRVDKGKLPDVLAYAGVPSRLTHAAVGGVEPMSVRSALTDALRTLRESHAMVGVAIGGTARSGKSTAAAAVLRYFAARGKTILWRTAENMTSTNYESVRGGEAEQVEADREKWRLQEVYDVLVIDNLDLLALTEFTARHILSVIRARADNELLTVVTQTPLAKLSAAAFTRSATLPAVACRNYIASAMILVESARVP